MQYSIINADENIGEKGDTEKDRRICGSFCSLLS